MFTVCPKCALTLVVTAADLRVAQGYVRCGRCSNVFNALARLSEDRQAAAAAAAQTPPPPPPPPPEPQAVREELAEEDEEPIPETALEFNPDETDVTKVFVEAPATPQWTAATGSFKEIVLRSGDISQTAGKETAQPAGSDTDTHVDVEIDADLLSASAQIRPNNSDSVRAKTEDVDVTSAVEPLPRPTTASQAKSAPQTRPSPQSKPAQPAATPSPAPPSRSPAEPRTAPRFPARASETRTTFDDTTAEQVGPGTRTHAAQTDGGRQGVYAVSPVSALWGAGTGALVILLVMQIVHHYRHDLAANPQLNRPLTALYAALGVSLVPRWNLDAYEVRQLGASADAETAGQITVRASVKNGAGQAQPLPLLRVTLQDRFGNRIAARDVPPQSYLPRAIPASSFLSSGQRIDAEMAFVDPGSNAVGFEIDACLPVPGGAIACANDPGSR